MAPEFRENPMRLRNVGYTCAGFAISARSLGLYVPCSDDISSPPLCVPSIRAKGQMLYNRTSRSSPLATWMMGWDTTVNMGH